MTVSPGLATAEKVDVAGKEGAAARAESLRRAMPAFLPAVMEVSRGAESLPRAQRWPLAFALLDRRFNLPQGMCEELLPRMAEKIVKDGDGAAAKIACAFFVLGDMERGEEKILLAAEAAETDEIAAMAYFLASYGAHERGDKELADKRRALAEAAQARGVNGEDIVKIKHQEALGLRLYGEGKLREALAPMRAAYEISQRVFGAHSAKTLHAAENLGTTLHDVGHHEEAVPILRQVVEVMEEQESADDLELAKCRNNYANALFGWGAYAAAADQHRMVLEVRREVLGEDHPKTIGAQANLAGDLSELARHDEAERLAREAVATGTRVQGAENEATLVSRMVLVEVLRAAGKSGEAEVECRDVLAARHRVLGPGHAHTLAARDKLAQLTKPFKIALTPADTHSIFAPLVPVLPVGELPRNPAAPLSLEETLRSNMAPIHPLGTPPALKLLRP